MSEVILFGLHDVIRFGKYKHDGLTIKEVIERDPEYIDWAVEEIAWFDLDDEAYQLLEEYLGCEDDFDVSFDGW